MQISKSVYLLISVVCSILFALPAPHAHFINLHQSVEQALEHSPTLKALKHSQEAVAYDLKQTRALYRPSIDLSLGYGLEQYSDETTREIGAVPSDTDWDSKEDASLTLTQKVYDGGENRSRVSIQKALLDSAHFRVQAAVQAITLDAITAHLEVYMQRELVKLAEKNLKVHHDIHKLLEEREQAGAGDIADVNQTQARLARARSDLFAKKADLDQAIAAYHRLVGSAPGKLAYARLPQGLPANLEEALDWTEQHNPELLALNTSLAEAEAKVGLARSPYKPKLNLELSSSYQDQIEGNRSWQNTNEAMLVMRWNLYKGGSDKAGEQAALSRKFLARSNRDALLLELREATSAAWTTYRALQDQEKASREAVNFSRNTFEAYSNQFSISKRSLLDLLNAESDYFQSASNLVMVSVNATVVAYRILSLGGALDMARQSQEQDTARSFDHLSHAIVFPTATQTTDPEPQVYGMTSDLSSTAISPTLQATSFSMEIGPFIGKLDLKRAEDLLQRRGLDIRRESGTAKAKFYRLHEGKYPPEKARQRLNALKASGYSTFVLPEEDMLSIYVGSFKDPARAALRAKVLKQENITVSVIESDVDLPGTMLAVSDVDQQTAETIAELMTDLGLPGSAIKTIPRIPQP